MCKTIWILTAALAAGAAQADTPGFIALTPDEITFQPVPDIKGVEVALLYGRPDSAGFYVMRAKFAPGVRSAPHVHDQHRFVTVISGTWHFGTVRSGECDGTKALGPGSFAHHPKGAVHYDGSCGDETVVEISGQGPVKTTWLGKE